MSSVIPGLFDFPFPSSSWPTERGLQDIENRISALVGPRRISVSVGAGEQIFRVSHVPLPGGNLFGMSQSVAVDITSPRIGCYQLMLPLGGHLICRPNIVVEPGAALIVMPDNRIDAHFSAGGTVLVLTVNAARIKALAIEAFRDLDLSRMTGSLVFDLADGGGRSFANVLGLICQENEISNSGFRRGVTTKALEDILLRALLMTLSATTGGGDIQVATLSGRDACMKLALDYIETNLSKNITPTLLASKAGTSIRTLQYRFLDQFGVGPMTYLKQRRLREIHNIFLRENPEHCSVGDVAAEWGFFNGSSFARTYHRTIGELPSETLFRKAKLGFNHQQRDVMSAMS